MYESNRCMNNHEGHKGSRKKWNCDTWHLIDVKLQLYEKQDRYDY